MKKALLNNQRGAALVTSLLIMSLLTVIGFSALNNSDIELKISGNERVSTQAFEAAEAGVEMAIAELRAGQLTTPKEVWSTKYPEFKFDENGKAMILTDETFPLDTESEVGAGKYGFKIYDNSTTEVSRAFIASTGRAGNDRSVRNLLVEVERNLAGSILDYAIYADEDLNLGNKSRVLSYRSDKTLHLTTDTDATGDKSDNTNTFDAETLEADIGSNTEINVGNFTYVGGDISLGADLSDVDATYTATGSNSVVLGVDSFETVGNELVLSENAYKGRVEVDELFFIEGTLLKLAIEHLASTQFETKANTNGHLESGAKVNTDSFLDLSDLPAIIFPLEDIITVDGTTLLKGYEIEYIDLDSKILTIENNGEIKYEDKNGEKVKTKDQINQINIFISAKDSNPSKGLSLSLKKSQINIETPVEAFPFKDIGGKDDYTKKELSTSILVDDIGNKGKILEFDGTNYYRYEMIRDTNGFTTKVYSDLDSSEPPSPIPYEGRRFSMLGNGTDFILDSEDERVLRDQIFYLLPEGVADSSVADSSTAYSSIKVLGAGVNIYTKGDIYFGTSGDSELNNNIYVGKEDGTPVLDDGNRIRLVNENGALILGPPTILSLYSITTGSIRFSTKTAFSGLIYAPYADVQIDNKAGFQGSVIAKSFTMTNEGSFLYDASLRPTDEERDLVSIKKLSWLEK